MREEEGLLSHAGDPNAEMYLLTADDDSSQTKEWNGENTNAVKEQEQQSQVPYRSVLIITTAIFAGYAVMVTLQKKLFDQYNLNYKESLGRVLSEGETQTLQHFCSANYVGNLFFRLAHNFIFAWLIPRHRVFVSLFAMIISMIVLGIFVFYLRSTWLAWTLIAYLLCGVSVGTFESNLLSAITPLGHDTKMWAIIGLPLGFNVISVGGFVLLSYSFVHPVAIYVIVLILCVVASLIFRFHIPVTPIDDNARTLTEFMANMREYRNWAPKIWRHALCLLIDMFAVSFFCGFNIYLYSDTSTRPPYSDSNPQHTGTVALFGQGTSTLINHDTYFAIYNLFTFFGDTFSRKFAYWLENRSQPYYFLVLTALGTFFCLLKIRELLEITYLKCFIFTSRYHF